MKIFYHPTFKKTYFELSGEIKKKAEKREEAFRKNPLNPQLKTHKLHGKLSHLWSFSVDLKYRIIFEWDGQDIIFLEIGDHSLY